MFIYSLAATRWCGATAPSVEAAQMMVSRRHLITPKGRSLVSAGECSLAATPDGAVQQRHQLQQFSDGIPLHLVGVP